MDFLIDTVAGSLSSDLSRLSLVSNNLSNINSLSFKRVVNSIISGDASVDGINIHQNRDFSVGNIVPTENSLDVALSGEGFFVVQQGDSTLLTRRGDFHIDSEDKLVTHDGLTVLGSNGAIFLSSDDLSIDQLGNIFHNDQSVDTLSIVKPIDINSISNVRDTYYRAENYQVVEDPGILQHHLEYSNVDISQEMVQLIEISRHFQMNQVVLRTYDELLANTINQFADISQ